MQKLLQNQWDHPRVHNTLKNWALNCSVTAAKRRQVSFVLLIIKKFFANIKDWRSPTQTKWIMWEAKAALQKGWFLLQFSCFSSGWVAPPAVVHTQQHFRQDHQTTAASTFGWWAIDKLRRFCNNFLCMQSPAQQPSGRKECYFCSKSF